MRRALLVLPLVLAGCAGEREDGRSSPRPPAPATITAAIERGRIVLAPETVGAGPLVVLVSNQSGAPRRVALEPRDAGLRVAGAVAPGAVARLALDAAPGRYALRVPGLPAATLRVGRPRPSSGDRLLLP